MSSLGVDTKEYQYQSIMGAVIGRLAMSKRERNRKPISERFKYDHYKLEEAAQYIHLSYQQTKRVWKRY